MIGSLASESEGRVRDGQWEAIDLAANQKSRALIVQRTGWGKSIVYFIAGKTLRDRAPG